MPFTDYCIFFTDNNFDSFYFLLNDDENFYFDSIFTSFYFADYNKYFANDLQFYLESCSYILLNEKAIFFAFLYVSSFLTSEISSFLLFDLPYL